MLIIILYTGETLLISHSQRVGATISLIPSAETLVSRRGAQSGSQGPQQYLHCAAMSGALAQQKSIVSSTFFFFLVQFFFFMTQPEKVQEWQECGTVGNKTSLTEEGLSA